MQSAKAIIYPCPHNEPTCFGGILVPFDDGSPVVQNCEHWNAIKEEIARCSTCGKEIVAVHDTIKGTVRVVEIGGTKHVCK